jgi:hypothetical protein
MRTSPPGIFWALAIIGPFQAALAASVLTENGWAWLAAAGGHLLWLALRVRPGVSAARLVAVGHLLPLAAYGGTYAALAVGARPEAAAAQRLTRPSPAPRRPSDVPTPRLLVTSDDRDVTRKSWRLVKAFLYLAACAAAGLFWHTPAVLYLAAAVAALAAIRLPEDSPC